MSINGGHWAQSICRSDIDKAALIGMLLYNSPGMSAVDVDCVRPFMHACAVLRAG
jgi:hypothetical protein